MTTSTTGPRAQNEAASIIIVDRSPLFAESLRRALVTTPGRVVATFPPGHELPGEMSGAVVVLDADDIGLAALTCPLVLTRGARGVVLVATEASAGVVRLAKEGGAAVVTRSETVDRLEEVLRSVFAGSALPPSRSPARPLPDALSYLTSREREVLTMIGRGLSNADVADAMSLSTHTVRTHVQNMYAKLGVNNRVAAAAVFRRPAAQNGRGAPARSVP